MVSACVSMCAEACIHTVQRCCRELHCELCHDYDDAFGWWIRPTNDLKLSFIRLSDNYYKMTFRSFQCNKKTACGLTN